MMVGWTLLSPALQLYHSGAALVVPYMYNFLQELQEGNCKSKPETEEKFDKQRRAQNRGWRIQEKSSKNKKLELPSTKKNVKNVYNIKWK